MRYRTLLSIILLITSYIAATAGDKDANGLPTAAEAYLETPSAGIFLIDSITRMDMLDYYRSGSATPSAAIIGGTARVTEEKPMSIKLTVGQTDFQLALLYDGKNTIIALIETVASTVPDSHITFYDRNWNELPKQKGLFKSPALKDWLTEDGKRERAYIEEVVPFIMAIYDYDPDSKVLTISNTMENYYTPEDWKDISAKLKASIAYRWNGKQFTKQ